LRPTHTPIRKRLLTAILAAGTVAAMGAISTVAQAHTSHRHAAGAGRHCNRAQHHLRKRRCGRYARYSHRRSHHRLNADRGSAGVESTTSAPTPQPAPVVPQACTNTELIPTSSNIAEVRTATLCLINRERALHGEVALTESPKLLTAAQGHSDDMITRDYFDHTTPTGEAFDARILASGYAHRGEVYELGENIDCGTLYLASPEATVKAWMNSPGHRENILNGEFRESGIGVVAAAPPSFAEGQPGATYTQDFGVIAS